MSRNHVLRFVKTTLIGGLVFLVPVFVLGLLLAKSVGILKRLAKPMESLLPLDRLYGVLIADAIAIALVILVCFIGGLLARVSLANRLIKKAETGILWRIPGYSFVRALTDSLEHNGTDPSLRPVLVHFDDYAQLSFEVDQLPDGRRVIYVPSAPDPRAGSVLIVDANRVEPLPISFFTATRLLRTLGRNSGQALGAGDAATRT